MHPDGRTDAPDTDYFIFGDGVLSVGLQWSRNREMSPYGLLLWQPGKFQRKDGTHLFHPELGLSGTMLTVEDEADRHRPEHETTRVRWASIDPVEPVVEVEWIAGRIRVVERFSIGSAPSALQPDPDEELLDHFLRRRIQLLPVSESDDGSIEGRITLGLYPNPHIHHQLPLWEENSGGYFCKGFVPLTLETEYPIRHFERFFFLTAPVTAKGPSHFSFFYRLPHDEVGKLSPQATGHFDPVNEPEETPDSDRTFSDRLTKQLALSRIGLNGVVSEEGMFDASIWQYGYEWGQDGAMAASACCYAGDFETAEAILENILARLTDDRGYVAESSRFREGELAELNAIGAVLIALRDHWRCTGEINLPVLYWQKIEKMVSLLCRLEHSHPSGLLVGRRDLWERLPWMGLLSGFDVATNTFCAEGLIAADELADAVGAKGTRQVWRERGEEIHRAMFDHLSLSFVEDGRIIHRRLLDGTVQRTMRPETEYRDERYAPYIPASVDDPTPCPCDPDSVSALPILYDMVDPTSVLARETLDHLHEHLWNPTGIGGYARSPLASDPDSPGPWPFVTAWMAEAELKAGLTERARETTEWLLKIAGEGGSWFEYYGERRTPPYPPVGIIVWGWAQYILLAVRGWMGIEVLSDRLRIAPRLVPYRHRFWVGERYVDIEVTGRERGKINGGTVRLEDGGVEIPVPLVKDYRVEIF